jgi:hypothetical protein
MQKTEKPLTLAEYLMIGIVQPMIKKPLFGKQNLPMNAYFSVGGFLFEQGATLGWIFRNRQIDFVQLISLPYSPEERIFNMRLAAKERVEKWKSSQDSFYLFIYETELARLGHPVKMVPQEDEDWSIFKEKLQAVTNWVNNQHFTIPKAWEELHFLFYEGIGYGFEFPEVTKQKWQSIYETVQTPDKIKNWHEAYKHGVITTPTPPSIQSWDEHVSELKDVLKQYVSEYKPELIYILDER